MGGIARGSGRTLGRWAHRRQRPQGPLRAQGSGTQLWSRADLGLNSIQAPGCWVTLGFSGPLWASSACPVQRARGYWPSSTGPSHCLPQEKPGPGEHPGLSQQRRHQSWSTFKSMTLGSLPPKPRERLGLHRAAAWEPTEPPDGDFQTEV